jgi:DNA topoisomerase-2
MNINISEYDLCKIDNIEIKDNTENNIFYDIEIENDNTFFIVKNNDLILTHNCDGSHIKGLLINLFDTYWPELLDMDFIYEFITPIVKIEKGKIQKYFYRLDEYKKWKETTDTKGYFIKYYKGLGTILPSESKLFFKDIDKHLIKFNTDDIEKERSMIDLSFNKKRTDDRKDWLLKYKPDFEFDKFKSKQTYDTFINKELIEFSMSDNIRSIPNMIDGLKPSQRKILYTMFKKNFKDQIKVSSLSGSVSECTSYHHGSVSLEGGIVGMSQNFINSNNLNLLEPIGQFGTRLKGGKDSSASRYIFTKLNPLTRSIFIKDDDNVVNYLNDDGQFIEPDFYTPIIPMILVNGSDGIGTGWSSDIPMYDTNDIIDYCINKIIHKRKNIELHPKYNKFKGTINWDDKNNRYITRGVFKKINSTKLVITELPIGMWNDKYYEILDKLVEENKIKDYIKKCTDELIDIDINVLRTDMKIILEDPYKYLNLESYLHTSNMYAFNEKHNLIKFENVYNLIDHFFDVRLIYYTKRKNHLIDKTNKEKDILYNRVNFINGVISNKIKVNKQSKNNIEENLELLKFKKIDDNYNYLLNMPIYSLTKEKMLELKENYENKINELKIIKNMESKKMWLNDLKNLKKQIK